MEPVQIFCGPSWREVGVRAKGGEGYLEEGGALCRLRPKAVFSGGRLLQLQHYYKAGLLGFMNKARK